MTTRWLARRARQIHLGFPEAAARLRAGRGTRVFTYGNPITPPATEPRRRARARDALGLPAQVKVLLVIGGSQGSRAINRAVADALAAGALGDVALLWSTGPAHFEQYRPLDRPPLVQVRPFWDPVATAYGAADLVVARAGAMTTAELCAYGLPSILVPFPHAAADHQNRNAEALERAGAAVRLQERALTGQTLARAIGDILERPARLLDMGRAAAARGQPDAAARIAAELLGETGVGSQEPGTSRQPSGTPGS
jgi:UDP-N-acetylglucosamine--N-acetylmuramyl-(pentapeptide) pyrophosphoryl-undecaprenol N-acetylglucosamine transferase